MSNLKSVFRKNITETWTKIVDFDTELGRKAGINEGFEVYCEKDLTIEFGIGTVLSEPGEVAFSLQKQLLWKYIQGIPVRGVLYARTLINSADIEVEV